MTEGAEKARLAQGTSVKEDLGSIYRQGDEAYAVVLKLSRDVRSTVETLTRLLAEAKTLKTNDTGLMSELTLLRDQTDTVGMDLASIQASVEGHSLTIQEISSQEMNVLASVVATLLDVNDALESLKGAVIGLNSHVKDHPCPWSRDDGTMTAMERIDAVTNMVKLFPSLQVVVQLALDSGGWELGPDGIKPREKYWAKRMLDRFRDAIIAAAFSTLASGAVGFFAWSYYLGPRSAVEKARQESKDTLQKQLVEAEKQNKVLQDRLAHLEALDAAKGKKRRATPE